MSMYCKYCGPEEDERVSHLNPCHNIGLHIITISCNYCGQKMHYKNDPEVSMSQNLHKAIRQWNIQQFLPKDKNHPQQKI